MFTMLDFFFVFGVFTYCAHNLKELNMMSINLKDYIFQCPPNLHKQDGYACNQNQVCWAIHFKCSV